MKCQTCGKKWNVVTGGMECPHCLTKHEITEDLVSSIYAEGLRLDAKRKYTAAAQQFAWLAREGYAEGEKCYGECLEHGRGVKQNVSEALAMYRRSAEQMLPSGMYAFFRCVKERDLREERPLAFFFLRVSAELSDADAMIAIADAYYKGEAVDESKEGAVWFYQKAAEQGSAKAYYALASMYVVGEGVKKNLQYAKWNVEKALSVMPSDLTKRRQKSAQILLASLEEETAKEPKPFLPKGRYDDIFLLAVEAEGRGYAEIAYTLFAMSGEGGNPVAQYRAGKCLLYGIGTEKNTEAAARCFAASGAAGYTEALLTLAKCYEEGVGVPQDALLCAEQYRLAAETGDPRAQYLYAECLFDGRLIPRDIRSAVRWYQKSALRAYPPAMEKIHEIFDEFASLFHRAIEAQEKGDLATAIRLYTVTAEMGHRGSACNLGYCYEMGIGVPRDLHTAVKYYLQAAEDGSPAARYNLGARYQKGGGIQLNYAKARHYLELARDGGYAEKADALLDEMNAHKQKKTAQKYYAISSVLYRREDLEGAIRFRIAAARLGHARAAYLLGCQFEFGDGLPQSAAQAAKWYENAAKLGFSDDLDRFKLGYIRQRKLNLLKHKVDH